MTDVTKVGDQINQVGADIGATLSGVARGVREGKTKDVLGKLVGANGTLIGHTVEKAVGIGVSNLIFGKVGGWLQKQGEKMEQKGGVGGFLGSIMGLTGGIIGDLVGFGDDGSPKIGTTLAFAALGLDTVGKFAANSREQLVR